MPGSLAPSTLARLVLIVAALLSAVFAPKGRKMMVFVGCGFLVLGLDYFHSGLIPQRWGGGPPVEGLLARFGGLFIAFSGACIVLISLLKKPKNQVSEDDHQQT
jgi:hypothetical protein